MDEQTANTDSETGSSPKKSIPYGARERTSGYLPTGRSSGFGSGASRQTNAQHTTGQPHSGGPNPHWHQSPPQQDPRWQVPQQGRGWSSSKKARRNSNDAIALKVVLAFVVIVGMFTIYRVTAAFISNPLVFIFGDPVGNPTVMHPEDGGAAMDSPSITQADTPEEAAVAPATEAPAVSPPPPGEAPAPAPPPPTPQPPALKQPVAMPAHHGGEIYGTGCTPGNTDVVPSGVWYGYMRSVQGNTMFFDMVCYRGPGNETNQADIVRKIVIDGFEPPNTNRIGVEVHDGVLINYWYAP